MNMTDAEIQAQIESNRRLIEETETILARASLVTQQVDLALSQALGCPVNELDAVLKNQLSADERRSAEAEFEKALEAANIAPVSATSPTHKTSTATRQHRRMV